MIWVYILFKECIWLNECVLVQIINTGGVFGGGGGSNVGTSDVLAQLQQVNNTDTYNTKSATTKDAIKEDTESQIEEDEQNLIGEDAKSIQIGEDAKSTQFEDATSSSNNRESKHALDPTNEPGYADLFLDTNELPQSVVARRSNLEVKWV